MKIIISPDLLGIMLDLEENEVPSITQILNNKYIKGMINKQFKVTSCYVDTVNATNMNNYVIEITPL